MARLKSIIKLIAQGFNWVALGGLFAIMVITCADVVGRSFRHPMVGAYDLICMIAVVAFAFALANSQIMRAHIGVDFLILRLPRRAQGVLEAITSLVSMGMFLLFAWRSAVLARSLWIAGKVTMTIELPYYLFVYGVGIACLPVSLVFLVDFLESLTKVVKK